MSDKFITFLPKMVKCKIRNEESVLEVALKNKIDLNHSCGGSATCGTCRVYVRSGLEKVCARNDLEAEMAEDRNFSKEERLSCQMEPVEDLVIEIP